MSDNTPHKRTDNVLDAELDQRLESWVQSKGGAEISSVAQKRIVEMLSPSLAPVKILPSNARLVLTFLGVFAACILAIVPLTGWMGFHLMTGEQIAGMVAILAGGAILLSFMLASEMVPGSATLFPIALALVLSGVALIGGIALLFPWHLDGRFASDGWPCAVLELVVAVPAAGLFWLVVRRGAPFRSPQLGAAIGGLSIFLALMVVQSQCMFPQTPHLLIWHGGVAALLVGLGALAGFAGRRFLMS